MKRRKMEVEIASSKKKMKKKKKNDVGDG